MNIDVIENVLQQPSRGGYYHSFRVLFTAENVLVLTGTATPDCVETIRAHYERNSGEEWKISHELASKIGAKLVMGHPAHLERLKKRLDHAESGTVSA